VAVRNIDRRAGPHQQGWESECPPSALRGRVGDAHALKRAGHIKTWRLKLAKTKCHAKARVAVARKLAVVMHAMWRDGAFYVGDPDASAQDVDAWNAAKVQRLSYANS